MKNAPNSYKDPYWANISSDAEKKVGLPEGLLNKILTRGERSNADQVSEAKAKTPYQIIPQTRDAFLKKYGVDAYLSPENSAEVAALVLKEGLDRNNGNVAQAVGEYHAGPNRENWGPKTKAYIARVMNSQPENSKQLKNENLSTFDKELAKQTPQSSTPSISAIYDAYINDKMTDQEAAEFESDVNNGLIILRPGAKLKKNKANTTTSDPLKNNTQESSQNNEEFSLAQRLNIYNAYKSGAMQQNEKEEFEADVKSGVFKLPEGAKLNENPGLIDKAIGAGEAALTTLTGATGGALGIVAGTVEGIAKSILDGTYRTQQGLNKQAEQLAAQRGAYLTYSPRTQTGQEYAENVGKLFQQMIPIAPLAGEAAMISAATKSAATALKAGAGIATDIAKTGATKATDLVKPVIAQTVDKIKSAPRKVGEDVGLVAPLEMVKENTGGMANVGPAEVPQSIQPLGATELAQTAKKATEGGLGSNKAKQILAEQASPDASTIKAAERLGISEYLQPDHVTTNQSYRELAQAIKSIPGSEARSAELQGLAQVAKRADDLITEIGGSHDLAQVSSNVKKNLESTASALESQADGFYSKLRKNIPAKTESPAPTVLKFIEQRAEDLGGKKNLSSVERMIQSKLAPKPITDAEGAITGYRQPSYALLDDVRRDLTAARIKNQGPFKDSDVGLIKKLESELKKDQRQIVDSFGMTETFDAAQKAVAVRKSLENDLISLFGKNIDGSIVGDLSSSVKKLPSGDVSKFVNLIKSVPQSMRQETVASGLAAAFGKSAKQGEINFNSYAKWYEGLLRNKQAHHALMANLPQAARKKLSDLYRVSKSISLASKERITTGRLQSVAETLKGSDNLLQNIYGLAKRSASGVAIEAITTPMGLPGSGLAAGIAAALMKGKNNVFKAADSLISSPEFILSVKQAAKGHKKQAAIKLSQSKAFNKFVKSIGNPKEISDKPKWILDALQKTPLSASVTSSVNNKQNNNKF